MLKPFFSAVALAIALGAAPALAADNSNATTSDQTPKNPATAAPANNPAAGANTSTAANPAAATGTATTSNNAATATVIPEAGSPSQRNPLLADNGDVRMSKLIGTNVYNKADKKLGSVDDVLMGSSGEPDVIISTNNKLVQVPWNKLQFGNAKLNSNNKAIIPDETQQALNQQPNFQYQKNH